jgi:hypothetical protein
MANNNDWHTPSEGLTIPPGADVGSDRVVIGSPSSGVIPADLIAFYAPEVIIAGIIAFTGTTYSYQVWLAAGGGPYTAFGGEDAGGIISESYRYFVFGGTAIFDIGFKTFPEFLRIRQGSALEIQDNSQLHVEDTAVLDFASGTMLEMLSGSNLTIDTGSNYSVDGVSAPRGLKAYIGSTGATGAIGAEAVVLTSAAMTFVDGRCYEVTWSHNVNGTVAAPGAFAFVRFRRTNLAGALLGFAQVHLPAAGAQNYGLGIVRVRRNAGAGNLVDNLVMTLQASAGTVTQTGAATDVRNFAIKDCGADGDYPNAIAI